MLEIEQHNNIAQTFIGRGDGIIETSKST